MSNLQTIARRCPVMGKALAIQSAKHGGIGGAAAVGAMRAFSGKINAGKAKLHTSRSHEARPIDGPLFAHEKSMISLCDNNFSLALADITSSWKSSSGQLCSRDTRILIQRN